jgi:hypothetical protein
MTRQSDDWDRRNRERQTKQHQAWLQHQAQLRQNQRMRDVLGMWEFDGDRCRYCDEFNCKRAICRTIDRFERVGGFGRKFYYYGPYFPLWSIVMYLKCMADGPGVQAAEFGKRFPHRWIFKGAP